MRKRQVWRYYCDFCKKANCSATSISEHEKHCTMNPERQCRMCKAAEQKQPSLAMLLSMLPNPDMVDTRTDDEMWNGSASPLERTLKDVLPLLRKEANNCPVCILVALRQKQISLPVDGFDYSEECKQFWTQVRDDEERREQNGILAEMYGS